jgi:hypothetical protein
MARQEIKGMYKIKIDNKSLVECWKETIVLIEAHIKWHQECIKQLREEIEKLENGTEENK